MTTKTSVIVAFNELRQSTMRECRGDIEPRWRNALRIKYEYSCVAATTSRPALMLEACMTGIGNQDAVALLELLAEICGCPTPKVTWGKRAWAKSKEWRIHLPQVGDMDVETVVHEFAHLLAEIDALEEATHQPHGGRFVMTLDRLLLESWPVWRAKMPSGVVLIMQPENHSERRQGRRD